MNFSFFILNYEKRKTKIQNFFQNILFFKFKDKYRVCLSQKLVDNLPLKFTINTLLAYTLLVHFLITLISGEMFFFPCI